MPQIVGSTYQPWKRAKGFFDGYRLRIAVGFPITLFDKISRLANRNDNSFAQQVIELCEEALDR